VAIHFTYQKVWEIVELASSRKETSDTNDLSYSKNYFFFLLVNLLDKTNSPDNIFVFEKEKLTFGKRSSLTVVMFTACPVDVGVSSILDDCPGVMVLERRSSTASTQRKNMVCICEFLNK